MDRGVRAQNREMSDDADGGLDCPMRDRDRLACDCSGQSISLALLTFGLMVACLARSAGRVPDAAMGVAVDDAAVIHDCVHRFAKCRHSERASDLAAAVRRLRSDKPVVDAEWNGRGIFRELVCDLAFSHPVGTAVRIKLPSSDVPRGRVRYIDQ